MNFNFKNINVRLKLSIIILIAIIPLLVLSSLRLFYTYNDKIDTAISSSQEITSVVSAAFQSYIQSYWLQQEGISPVIHTKNNSKEVLSYLKFNSLISGSPMVMTNEKGEIISGFVNDLNLKNFGDKDFFHQLQKGEYHVLSNIDINVLKGKMVILAATPILNSKGNMEGALISIIDINSIQNHVYFKSIGKKVVIGLLDKRGYLAYRSGNKNLSYEDRKLPKDCPAYVSLQGKPQKMINSVSNITKKNFFGYSMPIDNIGWACFTYYPSDDIFDVFLKQVVRELSLMLILILLVGVLIHILSNYIVNPINLLKESAEKISKGDYSVRTKIEGKDEISITAQAFDKMAEDIEQYDKLKSQFFSNISHELKTPINVIFATSQLLLNTKSTNDIVDYKRKVRSKMIVVKQNCFRLMRLVNNLVDITRFDSGFLKTNLRNNNIVSIVEEITLSIVKYAETLKIKIIFDTDIEELIIGFDPDMMERIVLNLISNSLKFTKPNGYVFVNILHNDSEVTISVRDTGIGISEELHSTVFERFRQVDSSLSKNKEGSGIGLSLVKALVEAQGGTISLKSKLGHGAEFMVILPNRKVPEDDSQIENPSNTRNIVEKIDIEFSDIYNS